MNRPIAILLACCAGVLGACRPSGGTPPEDATADVPTAAAAFVQASEARLEQLGQLAERQGWVLQNFITPDTELLAARASEQLKAAQVEIAAQAAGFIGAAGLDDDTRRKLHMLRSGIVVPAPLDTRRTAEQAEIGARLAGMYGAARYCRADGDCLALGELENIMAEARDPAVLLEAWDGWHATARPMKDMYARQVELANEGARELGFPDLGAMWRSGYDMDPAAFPGTLDTLWEQVRPLYEALHCHVRARLGEAYGSERVPQEGSIPAHLLGNMWAQNWENIYDLVAPATTAVGYDLTRILNERQFDPVRMVQMAEAFFRSLGFDPLPQTFWERSLFSRPADRDVICHPSAWTIDEQEDVRLKMCIDISAGDFRTVHHELGHDYYYLAYRHHSYLYRAGANDGFHEAVGDTVGLSITPDYLASTGLLDEVPDPAADLGLLMRQALDKIAFLPFGLLVDQWRWKVFAGEVGPDGYNELWWRLREQYQGVSAPNARPADAFDPGAKYHVPTNTPYARYFLAQILQYQMHRALCEAAGNEGPAHRCTIYGSQQAGERLRAMLELGRSRPWPEALAALTGSSEMDAGAILDYFAPLQAWLNEQNAGRQCGW